MKNELIECDILGFAAYFYLLNRKVKEIYEDKGEGTKKTNVWSNKEKRRSSIMGGEGGAKQIQV